MICLLVLCLSVCLFSSVFGLFFCLSVCLTMHGYHQGQLSLININFKLYTLIRLFFRMKKVKTNGCHGTENTLQDVVKICAALFREIQ